LGLVGGLPLFTSGLDLDSSHFGAKWVGALVTAIDQKGAIEDTQKRWGPFLARKEPRPHSVPLAVKDNGRRVRT
jgi:hypothetical protein